MQVSMHSFVLAKVCEPQAVKEDCDWSQVENSGGSFLPCEATLDNHYVPQ